MLHILQVKNVLGTSIIQVSCRYSTLHLKRDHCRSLSGIWLLSGALSIHERSGEVKWEYELRFLNGLKWNLNIFISVLGGILCRSMSHIDATWFSKCLLCAVFCCTNYNQTHINLLKTNDIWKIMLSALFQTLAKITQDKFVLDMNFHLCAK